MDVLSLTPGVPTFDDQKGLSVIVVNVNAEGIYFDVADFMYNIETLPRAAVVTSLSLAPGELDPSGVPRLTASATIELYTTDSSAGPGSVPGVTTGGSSDGEAG
jgi:Tfp pilus assembly protein PilO